ncbi:HAMP domain-containing histidine kinase [Rhodobacteraceae bacterium B1Z28]|uniref:histidine kinase n=1 Tax=Ruegeria haliotis TaxID=2747601 RepID=A0ABX2PKF3_9RHOB|nr:HAMP domain-containing sensor histidine kinase [Ruegeria haliotis]NVO54179.1 HAMP domain-containing histidine kinase [Ruegeria haliotis]
MRVTSIINTFAMLMLLLALGGTGLAYWSAERTKFFSTRTALANRSYEAHLQLSSNIYQLFKQYGDAMLIGDRDRGAGEAELIIRIRANISTIRGVIAEEIELVGDEEFEELELLSRIERRIEDVIQKFENAIQGDVPDGFSRNWSALSSLLDHDIDRDFRVMIGEALDEELEEVEETRADTEAHIVLIERIAFLFAILSVIVTILSIASYRRSIAKPLAHLIQGVREFSHGNFANLINLKGKTEISEIGQVLDDMAIKVESRTQELRNHNAALEAAVANRTRELERLLDEAQSSEAARRQLLADVSHELRTPLTIIQGECDVTLRGDEKPAEEYQQALRRARDTAKHTNRLVDDLLFVSRQEAGMVKLEMEETNLGDLVSDTASLFDASVSIKIDVDNAILRVDPHRIRQAVFALMQNARRYGGEELSVRVDQSPAGYSIAVEDRGPGMDDAEKKRAFDRFFRGSNAADSDGSGTGLGLPIVRAIVEAHGGKATLLDREGGGLISLIKLPKGTHLSTVEGGLPVRRKTVN